MDQSSGERVESVRSIGSERRRDPIPASTGSGQPAFSPDSHGGEHSQLSRRAVPKPLGHRPESSQSQSADKTVTLARQPVKFNSDEWQTLRLTFHGEELKVEVAGITAKAQDPIFAQDKERMHFIAIDGEVALRRLIVTK